MKRNLLKLLLCSAGLMLGSAVQAETAGPCAIAADVRADGSVELSNTGATTPCEAPPIVPDSKPNSAAATAPVSAPPAKSADKAADTAAAPAADAQSAQADAAKDPRQQYRDTMLQGTTGTATNPSVSRRYKMMDKSTYQATVLSGAPQDPPAGTPPSQ